MTILRPQQTVHRASRKIIGLQQKSEGQTCETGTVYGEENGKRSEGNEEFSIIDSNVTSHECHQTFRQLTVIVQLHQKQRIERRFFNLSPELLQRMLTYLA